MRAVIDLESLTTAMKPKVALNAHTLNLARAFVFKQWIARAIELGHQPLPMDLTNSCKFSSLFAQRVFGGTIEANESHCFNRINGKVVDINEFAMDTISLDEPHECDEYFMEEPEFHESMTSCLPRVERWCDEFIIQALQQGHGISTTKKSLNSDFPSP